MQVSWLAKFWWLLKRAFITVYEDGCLGIAKGAAYSGLLSFFPILTTVALGLVQLKADEAANIISRFLFEVVPPGTEDMVRRRFTERGETPETLLVFAGLVSPWAASGLILSLVEGFNAVYKIPTNRPLVRGRLVAIGLVFSAAIPALGATALIIFGSRSE
ncbi:MAG: YihY/virulence factor BrkB family protein, partial [bacterium]|nr:YihY/virulence factor BrkB family protein [bacterium]